MIYLAAAPSLLAFALLGFCIWQARTFNEERDRRERAFSEERGIWIRERRDLNNRIQIPEAAPYMEPDEGPSPDDLPLPPEFVVDEDELQKAVQHLESVGYESGPAT